MSWIRWIGLLIGIVGLFWSLRGRMTRRLSRGEAILVGLGGGFLVAVALEPSVVDPLLLFKKTGRIVTLLIIGEMALLGGMIFLGIRLGRLEERLGNLIHNMALRDFTREFGERADFARKILIIIPAYNEAGNLRKVLGRIPKKVRDYEVEVIVAVDGATDDTEQVVREFDIPAVVNQVNRGGGAALRAGYELALRHGAEIVVTMDADGQHQPEEIPTLVEPIVRGEADLVNGSRVLGRQEKGDLARQAGIVFFNLLLSVLLRRRITDCSNAFRAIRTECLASLNLREEQFHTTELLIEAISKGMRYKEVPITVTRRQMGESKKPKTLRYGTGVLMAIAKTWLRT
jgi:hypothetical protein